MANAAAANGSPRQINIPLQVANQPQPGQPLPQGVPLPQMAQVQPQPIGLAPAPTGYAANPGSAPTLVGNTGAPTGKTVFNRDLTSLQLSSQALENARKGGSIEELALINVFKSFAQVRVTLPSTHNPSSFLGNRGFLSKLYLQYLELSGPRGDVKGDADLFQFMDRSSLVRDALSALNAVASQSQSSVQLGLELSAVSKSNYGAMLDTAHAALRNALAADKLTVYLSVNGLLQDQAHDSQYFEFLLEGLEKHPALQHLVLGDAAINERQAQQIVNLIRQSQALKCVDLSACSVSSGASQILAGGAGRVQVKLPG